MAAGSLDISLRFKDSRDSKDSEDSKGSKASIDSKESKESSRLKEYDQRCVSLGSTYNIIPVDIRTCAWILCSMSTSAKKPHHEGISHTSFRDTKEGGY